MTEIHKRSVTTQTGVTSTSTAHNTMNGQPKLPSNQRRIFSDNSRKTTTVSSPFDMTEKHYLPVLLYKRSSWQVGTSLLLLIGFLVTFSSRWGIVTINVTSAVSKSLRSATSTQGPKPTARMLHRDTNTTRPTQQRDRPYFVFHIGPPKTATTSLQWALTRYKEVLTRDSYYYLGQTMLSETNM